MATNRQAQTQTTRRTPPDAGPTFGDLMKAAGKRPVVLSVETEVSVATIYAARAGERVPGPLYLKALAAALGVTADECRAAIERSRGKAGAA